MCVYVQGINVCSPHRVNVCTRRACNVCACRACNVMLVHKKRTNVCADGIMNEGEKLSLVWIRSQHHKSSAVTVSVEFPERRNQCQLMSSDRVILTNPIPGP